MSEMKGQAVVKAEPLSSEKKDYKSWNDMNQNLSEVVDGQKRMMKYQEDTNRNLNVLCGHLGRMVAGPTEGTGAAATVAKEIAQASERKIDSSGAPHKPGNHVLRAKHAQDKNKKVLKMISLLAEDELPESGESGDEFTAAHLN
jgi:Zn-dependent M32 family carboxypeptidase